MAALGADQINQHVGYGVRVARHLRRLDVGALARRAGIAADRLAGIEAGSVEATGRELVMLAQALGVGIDFFFDGLSENGVGDGRAADGDVDALMLTQALVADLGISNPA